MASREELQILQQQRKESKAYLDELLAGKSAEERMNVKKDKAYKAELAKLREINEQVKEIQSENKIIVDNLIQQESSLKSISGIQSGIGQMDRKRVDMQAKSTDLTTSQHEAINGVAGLIQDVSKLSAEDSIAQKLTLDQLDEKIAELEKDKSISRDIIENLKDQRKQAEGISNLTDKQQKFLNKQLEAYDTIKDSIGGVLETASLLTSNLRGGVGLALIGAGAAGKKLLNTSYELGGATGAITANTTLMGLAFEDAVGTTKGLASEFGGLADVSLKTQFRTNVLAKNLGIGAGEAAKLTGSFARLNDGSQETAQNLIQATKNLAEQNGLVPNQVMADVANSAETFALFGKDGGKNIAEAAVAAAKLGVSMSQIAGVADNLLDFESSINAELELGAMLGRNINLDRARALAYEGDIGGSVRETLSALGGIEEFNKMDYFQKKQTAALLGVSVDEFQKMADNADKLGKNGEIIPTQYEAALNNAKAFGSQLLTGVQALGGMAVAAGQMGFSLKDGLASMKGMGGLGGKIGKIFGGGASAAGPLTKAGKPDMRFNANKQLAKTAGGGGIGGMMKGMGAGMKGLAKGVSAFASPQALLGLAAVTAAIIGIGFALKVAAPGIEAFGKAIGNIITSVGTAVATIFGGLGDFFGKIAAVATPELALSVLGLAGGFAALTASLLGFSVAGIAAIPAMMAVSAFGAASSLLGLGGEGGAGGDSDLLGEIRGLREDLNNGKVAVYLDGKKVTAGVARVANASSFNSYSSN